MLAITTLIEISMEFRMTETIAYRFPTQISLIPMEMDRETFVMVTLTMMASQMNGITVDTFL